MLTGFNKLSIISIFCAFIGLSVLMLLVASIFGYWGPAEGTDKLGLF